MAKPLVRANHQFQVTDHDSLQSLSTNAPWARSRLWSLALLLGTLVLYFPVGRSQFLGYDDPAYVTENRVVLKGLTWSGVKWAFTTTQASNWHPLTWLSHMLDCQLFGADAGAAHLVNAGWHAVNAVLLFQLLLRLTGVLWPSLFAAALFAWHPLRVESVAWAAERKDALSAFFFLLTLLAYIGYVRKEERTHHPAPKQSSRQKGPAAPVMTRDVRAGTFLESPLAYYAASLLFFALGLMSKPMVVTTPFVLLLLDFWPFQRVSASDRPRPALVLGKLLLEKWPFFVLAAASCVSTFLAQQTEAVVPLSLYPATARIGNAVLAYTGYLFKTLYPIALVPIYPMPRSVAWLQVAGSGTILIGISWLCWRVRRTRPHLLVGWFWFLGTLVPVIGLVQVGSQTVADRYTYIPHIGLLLALTVQLHHWVSRWKLRPGLCVLAAGLLVTTCFGLTSRQIRYWKDGQTLFTRNVAVTPNSPLAQFNLGIALEKNGSKAAAQEHYEQALQLNSALPEAHRNLGDLLNELGKTNEAIFHYRQSLRFNEAQPVVHENLGAMLVKLGAFDEAMTHYMRAAQLDPQDVRSHYLMGKALLRQGHSLEALQHFRDALRRDPEDIQTLVYAARVLAADTNAGVRNGTEAVLLAEQANALSGDSLPFMLDTLAIAYAGAARFAEARATQQRAIDRATATGETDALAEMRHRLQLYQTGQPYRESFANSQGQ